MKTFNNIHFAYDMSQLNVKILGSYNYKTWKQKFSSVFFSLKMSYKHANFEDEDSSTESPRFLFYCLSMMRRSNEETAKFIHTMAKWNKFIFKSKKHTFKNILLINLTQS